MLSKPRVVSGTIVWKTRLHVGTIAIPAANGLIVKRIPNEGTGWKSDRQKHYSLFYLANVD
ncbi:hypothetical protein KZP17_09695 [Bifidobacterium pseudocatenulatum]|uniref:hypothetical protein n=1 Tax=Bifidobacterium pseudocatenulatum TaxID=28026 RepID=UPI001CFE9B5B|nr:hypothetical protein [Bifidobacterium pseudocatenulatum]MCB4902664.1 hypothetical protein [Bifidobacterium pseudocatenulatum]